MPYQVQQLEPQKATDMVDVFISYSRKDIEFAQRLHHELEARDLLIPVVTVSGLELKIALFLLLLLSTVY